MPQSFSVILPDTGQGLLRQEISVALQCLGIRVHRVSPKTLATPGDAQSLPELLSGEPCLLLSINMQGLENPRHTLPLLQKNSSVAVVWFIDNPWNVLSSVKDKLWHDIPLCVTDASFLGPLLRNGAKRVLHLPLAACHISFRPHQSRDAAFPPPDDLAPFVFVGRSAFPGKETFFSGVQLSADMARTARRMLAAGKRPDLSWWETSLGLETAALWPGKQARTAALGAENASLIWRSLCLAAYADCGKRLTADLDAPGLDIFGDNGWQGVLPSHARLRPPVDYYARLPGIYAKARYSLCMTSLQLPKGLNQRHFDIWMADGFCLTDATPGLELFPPELTRYVTFTGIRDIQKVVARLESNPSLRNSLQADWQHLLLEKHTYVHRMRTLFDFLGWG